MAEKKSGRFREALHHYADLATTGSKPYVDSDSLRWTCDHAMTSSTDLSELIADPLTRKLMTAWVICHGRWKDSRYERPTLGDSTPTSYFDSRTTEGGPASRWLDAVRPMKAQLEPSEQDTMAFLAYVDSRFAEADEWLRESGAPSATGMWIKAKLLLRAGKIPEGTEELRKVVAVCRQVAEAGERNPDTGLVHPEVASAELGVLLTSRRDFTDAMDLFARSTNYRDTAYLAERVLTTSELEKYLKDHGQEPHLNEKDRWLTQWLNDTTLQDRLRYLLARRFVRASDWDKARKYMPVKHVAVFDDYVRNLKEAKDAKRTKKARAESWFRAGWIARHRGMELMGAELDPDWTLVDGMMRPHDDEWASRLRFQSRPNVFKKPYDDEPLPAHLKQPEVVKALSASSAEKQRVAKSAPTPSERFHYRAIASEHMLECARLLPDNDELLAAALYHGGTWHSERNQEYADRFYQLLVRRCSKLPIGEAAECKRWFPDDAPPTPSIRIAGEEMDLGS